MTHFSFAVSHLFWGELRFNANSEMRSRNRSLAYCRLEGLKQMDNIFDVIQKALELSATILEGMEHIHSKFNAGHYEDVLPLFQDVIQALISIQEAIQPMSIQLPVERLECLADALRVSLDQIALAYEQSNWGLASESMQNQLLPGYLTWKEELARCLGSYIAS
ncbi:MAG TPA: hypothetical protein VN426_00710 [Syntrophomonadaceae bacterium]|nr:hypothetical protein [Syntrophomonadaceae bacterium]